MVTLGPGRIVMVTVVSNTHLPFDILTVYVVCAVSVTVIDGPEAPVLSYKPFRPML